MRTLLLIGVGLAVLVGTGCGSSADALGVGSQCAKTSDCDTSLKEVCLSQFKGGYCGLAGCTHDTDCPMDSACIAHTDGQSYCFRTCADKSECNANRDPDNEANCSSSTTFVDGDQGRKACIPPSA